MSKKHNHHQIADNWRSNNGYTGKGGVIFNGKAQGWGNSLRDPQHWTPGCIAVSEDGTCHKATGGNDYDGAKYWTKINSGQIPCIRRRYAH